MRKRLTQRSLKETSFPVEIVIAEDGSSDGSRKVLEGYAAKYPDLIRLLPAEPNMGLMRNYYRLLKACKGKYVACCAADDYWHDPLKLEKQVSFLEKNPEYGLVHTDANYYHEGSDHLMENYKMNQGRTIPDGDVFEPLFLGKLHISALTACIRKELFDKYVDFENFIKMGFTYEDLPTWLELARHTKFKFLKDATATYRVVSNSISRPADMNRKFDFVRMRYKIKKYYIDRYQLSESMAREAEKMFHEQKFELAYKKLNKEEVHDSYNYLRKNGYANGRYSLKNFLVEYPVLYRIVGRINRLWKSKEAMLEWN